MTKREKAEFEYQVALSAWRDAASKADDAEFQIINDRLTLARKLLVREEIADPTKQEIKRDNNMRRIRNRGLDV